MWYTVVHAHADIQGYRSIYSIIFNIFNPYRGTGSIYYIIFNIFNKCIHHIGRHGAGHPQITKHREGGCFKSCVRHAFYLSKTYI